MCLKRQDFCHLSKVISRDCVFSRNPFAREYTHSPLEIVFPHAKNIFFLHTDSSRIYLLYLLSLECILGNVYDYQICKIFFSYAAAFGNVEYLGRIERH